jgi:hypothetical protein
MRKRLITPILKDAPSLDEDWLDLDRETVEVTSEQKDYPVEAALVAGDIRGLACRRVWHSKHPANLRSAAKT